VFYGKVDAIACGLTDELLKAHGILVESLIERRDAVQVLVPNRAAAWRVVTFVTVARRKHDRRLIRGRLARCHYRSPYLREARRHKRQQHREDVERSHRSRGLLKKGFDEFLKLAVGQVENDSAGGLHAGLDRGPTITPQGTPSVGISRCETIITAHVTRS